MEVLRGAHHNRRGSSLGLSPSKLTVAVLCIAVESHIHLTTATWGGSLVRLSPHLRWLVAIGISCHWGSSRLQAQGRWFSCSLCAAWILLLMELPVRVVLQLWVGFVQILDHTYHVRA